MHKKVKFGVFVSNWEPFSYNPEIYERVALEAEELGYDFYLLSNHFTRPGIGTNQPLPAKNHTTLDTWSLLPYLAAKTRRIKLGACVTPITIYNPFLLAKMASTVDVLSRGRLIFGAGAGYEKREFEIYGKWEEAPVRVKKFEESLRLMKKLWSEENVNFEGRYYNATDVPNEPKPVLRGSLPIWIGAMSSVMLKITARIGDVWIPSLPLGATLEFYEKSSKLLARYSREANRQVGYGLVAHVVKEGVNLPFQTLGTMETCRTKLEQYVSSGLEYLATVFLPVDSSLELVRKFAHEIVPSFS